MENLLNLIAPYLTEHNLLLALCALIAGVVKSGIPGFAVVLPLIILPLFDAKMGLAIQLGFFLMGDTGAVISYRFGSEPKKLYLLFYVIPFALIGVVIAAILGNYIDIKITKKIIGAIIITGLLIIQADRILSKQNRFPKLSNIKHAIGYKIVFGTVGGFASTIGNAGGPIMSMFLMSMSIPKQHFVVIIAWFFFVINNIKMQIHLHYWHTVTLVQVSQVLLFIPFIVLGLFIGMQFLKILPEKFFKIMTTTLSFISGFSLLIF